jgi:hypothetical protein
MSTQIQRRRGTTAEHSTFTGVEGELTVDTTKDTAVVHDGTTVGGHPLQKQYPPLGSAAAPTYTFTGDTNTGIFSPSADQVAVATNGTGRLFVDASGRIGIAGSPSASSNTYLQVGYAGIGSDHVAYNYDSYFANNLYKSANSAWSRISTRAGGLLRIDDDTFTYSTADSGTAGASATLSERLRITSAGLVGIGNSSPATTLDVVGGYFTGGNSRTDTDTKTFGLLLPHVSSATNPVNIIGALSTTGQNLVYIGGSDSNLTGTSATTIHFYTAANATTANGTERMRITAAGLVGIGTSSPSSDGPLTLANATETPTIFFSRPSGGSYSAAIQAGSFGTLTFYNGAASSTVSGLTPRMTINGQTGAVGIGTTSPSSPFVVSDGGAGGVELHGNSSGDGRLLAYNRSGAAYIGMRYNALNHQFLISDTERARIDSSGRLLVGTSTYSGGTRAVFRGNTAAPGTQGVIVLQRDSANPGTTQSLGEIRFVDSNDGFGAGISATPDGGWNSPSDCPTKLVFSTTADGASSPTERMRIKANGATCIGTSTEGTMSGDTVVAIGPNIGIISKSASGVATSGTADISINTAGGGYQGFLVVSNTNNSSAATRTHATFSVFGRGTDSSIQQIAVDNGTTAGASFTVTTPTNGVIRVTNTSAHTTDVQIQFFGGLSG